MMNIKAFYLIILISFPTVNSEIRDTYATKVPIKGYWVRKVEKEDVESIQLNRRLKSEEKPYSRLIDYKEEKFFIPLDSLNAKRKLVDILNEKLIFYDKQVFFPPSAETQLYIKKYCNADIPIKNITALYNYEAYYSVNDKINSNNFLYNITYFEGESFYCQVDNTAANKRYLSMIYRIDASLPRFNCFFIFKTTKLEFTPALQRQGVFLHEK